MAYRVVDKSKLREKDKNQLKYKFILSLINQKR